MVFKNANPENWKDLQNKVCRYLSEIGFKAISPKIISCNDGEFEIDVFAELQSKGLKQKILIECKLWDTNVPQDVVFSIITRVNISGANMGIIISKKGFQSGAIKAAKNKNIELFTYNEFLKHFIKEWLDVRLTQLYKELSFLDNNIWNCILENEEKKTTNSEVIQKYGYILYIYSNMKSGICINSDTYKDEYFLYLIPQKVLVDENKYFEVYVLGDAFRLFFDTNLLNQMKNVENSYLFRN